MENKLYSIASEHEHDFAEFWILFQFLYKLCCQKRLGRLNDLV